MRIMSTRRREADDISPGAVRSDAVEFARGVHSEMWAINQSLVNRAQVVLTLNGVILGVLGAGLTSDPRDLHTVVEIFGWSTWGLLAIAGAALVGSIVCCAQVMASSFWKKPPLAGHRREASLRLPLEAEYMWFFRDLAQHASAPDDYVTIGSEMSQSDETRARLSQALAMAPNVRRRAWWVNSAFGLIAIALIFFAIAAADYIVRVAA
jgi:hypothetical protein